MAVNGPILPETENAVNAARVTIGADIEILELDKPLLMEGWVKNGVAGGSYSGLDSLVGQVADRSDSFDALAIATPITIKDGVALDYFRNTGCSVNPWGGIEALVSRRIASAIDKPVAHAPVESPETKHNPELMEILYREVVIIMVKTRLSIMNKQQHTATTTQASCNSLSCSRPSSTPSACPLK